MNPEKLMDSLTKELNNALKSLSKAKSVEEKVAYSQVVKNVSEALGIFFSLAGDMIHLDMDDKSPF